MLVAFAAAPVLSGCVAAAALPVLAAGGVVKARADGRTATAATPPATPADALPVSPRPPASVAPASARAAVVDGDAAYRLTTLTALPPPTGGASPPAVTQAGGAQGYAVFADYAARRAAQPVIGTERRSAMLANPTTMNPETRVCSVQPASVLIDLDPGQAAFDLGSSRPSDPELASRLSALRDEGVIIGWVSSRTADQAGMVRRALRQTGLDPDGSDELVLLRFPEERKQTRREDFAKSHCVVAIAGDQKADFDELFAFLRDPALALPLDKLIGAGWFIAPPPLATN